MLCHTVIPLLQKEDCGCVSGKNPHIQFSTKMRFDQEGPHQPKNTVQDEENVVKKQPDLRGACNHG